jgi:hypothetical protein
VQNGGTEYKVKRLQFISHLRTYINRQKQTGMPGAEEEEEEATTKADGGWPL